MAGGLQATINTPQVWLLRRVMNQLPGTGAELHRGRITNVMAVFDDHR